MNINDGMKRKTGSVIHTESDQICDKFCQTRLIENAGRDIGLKNQKDCQIQHIVSAEKFNDSDNVNCQTQPRLSTPIRDKIIKLKSQSIRQMLIKLGDTENRNANTRTKVVNSINNRDINVVISPLKPNNNKNKKVNSIDRVLRHSRKDDTIKKPDRNKVQMIVRELESKIEPKKIKSQGSKPKRNSAKKNVNKKKVADPNQPHITAFYGMIRKDGCELQSKE